MLDRNRGALLLLTAQKHAREHLSSPQNARRSRCLDRWLRVCYEWCHFQKSAGTVRSRFCKNRSEGVGELSPTSEKWRQATLLATNAVNIPNGVWMKNQDGCLAIRTQRK